MTCRTISLVICEKEKELHYENVTYFKNEKLVIHLVKNDFSSGDGQQQTHTHSLFHLHHQEGETA